MQGLESVMRNGGNKSHQGQFIMNVELTLKQSIYGYTGDDKVPFLRIYLASPKIMASVRGVLEKGAFNFGRFGNLALDPYESNISFALRFMIDTKVTGCNWIEVPAGKYKVIADEKKVSNTQLEIDVL